MADIHDYQDAAAETRMSLEALYAFGGRVEEGNAPDRETALAVALAGTAIANAVREAATRFDYVTREVSKG